MPAWQIGRKPPLFPSISLVRGCSAPTRQAEGLSTAAPLTVKLSYQSFLKSLAEYESDDLRPPAICLGWSWPSLGGKTPRTRDVQLRLRRSAPYDAPMRNLKVAGRIFPLFEFGACSRVRRTT